MRVRRISVFLFLIALLVAGVLPSTPAVALTDVTTTQPRTYGVTADNKVVTMEGLGVGHVAHVATIGGIQPGEVVLGIDVRPSNGKLYLLGSTSRIYLLDPTSGWAMVLGPGPFTPALSGTSFGFDFNPTVDRIRVVSNTGQNLRLNPDTGVVAATDTALAFATGDTNASDTPSVVAAAYTNNVPTATTTVLYDLESGNNALVTQNPSNAGTLNTVGPLTGLTLTAVSGFDIGSDGAAVALVTTAGTSQLYGVNLTTGAATSQGTLPVALTDIAVGNTAGYFFVASDGGVFNYGDARFVGSAGGSPLNAPIVGIAPRAAGRGYWMAASDGGVFTFGDAPYLGSTAGAPNKPTVGIVAHPGGIGYWLYSTDGGIFNFGTEFYGSAGNIKLKAPIVGMAVTPTGYGYWLFAADGGVFNYGDAGFYGSAGSVKLNKPIVGGAAAADGNGYYLVASDGGVFAYGSGAHFSGSAGSIVLNKPIVGITADPDGRGYWLAASDGGVFSYDAKFLGSAGGIKLNKPVVAIAAQ